MYDVQLLIDGNDCSPKGQGWFERCDPISGAVVSRAAAAGVDDAILAVEAAERAFPSWAATAPKERRQILNAAAARLRTRAADLVERIIAETGSSQGWAHFNVAFGAEILEEAAALTTQPVGEVIPSNHGATSMAIRKPAGVSLGMAPWNAPVILGLRSIAVPLAVGNTVILKSSEICPGTHRLLGDILMEAGVPAGVVNVVSHTPQDAAAIVEAMVSHPAVRRINFTGSTNVGRMIGRVCGYHLKPVILELGGKASMVVLDDANIDAAVEAAAFGAFMHQGQICMSTERIVVDEAVADDFVQKLATKLSNIPTGEPAEGKPFAACVDLSTVERVRRLIADAKSKGASVVVEGQAEGTLMGPTLVDHVTADMAIYRDESFGPVLAVIRVKGDDEALSVANDTDYGLSAAVHSRDLARALKIAERIDSGICHINGPTVQDEPQMPFGGVKASGYGRFGGAAGRDFFTEIRWLTIQKEPRKYPF